MSTVQKRCRTLVGFKSLRRPVVELSSGLVDGGPPLAEALDNADRDRQVAFEVRHALCRGIVV